MRKTMFALAALLTVGTVLAQERVITQQRKIGVQSITTLDTIYPPIVWVKENEWAFQGQLEKSWAKGVVLTAKEWKGGHAFTDDQARRWCLACGTPIAGNPLTVTGWLIRTDDGRIVFFSTSGRMFTDGSTPVLPPPVGIIPPIK